jgi:hypothetical protein
LSRNSCLVYISYIDDFFVASVDEQQHVEHLRKFLERMNDYSVVINLTKYEFDSSKNTFLEYTVNADGIKPLAGRVEAIVNVPKPATVKQLRNYLGMFYFYRGFTPASAKILQLLNDLLKGAKNCNAPIEWSEQTENSFRGSKRAFADGTILASRRRHKKSC